LDFGVCIAIIYTFPSLLCRLNVLLMLFAEGAVEAS
jgi:hypothetical protein